MEGLLATGSDAARGLAGAGASSITGSPLVLLPLVAVALSLLGAYLCVFVPGPRFCTKNKISVGTSRASLPY